MIYESFLGQKSLVCTAEVLLVAEEEDVHERKDDCECALIFQ